MKVPEFNAEISLIESSTNHRSVAKMQDRARSQYVTPAFVNSSCCRTCQKYGGDCYPTYHGCYCF
jgi:hypothetical protein